MWEGLKEVSDVLPNLSNCPLSSQHASLEKIIKITMMNIKGFLLPFSSAI